MRTPLVRLMDLCFAIKTNMQNNYIWTVQIHKHFQIDTYAMFAAKCQRHCQVSNLFIYTRITKMLKCSLANRRCPFRPPFDWERLVSFSLCLPSLAAMLPTSTISTNQLSTALTHLRLSLSLSLFLSLSQSYS